MSYPYVLWCTTLIYCKSCDVGVWVTKVMVFKLFFSNKVLNFLFCLQDYKVGDFDDELIHVKYHMWTKFINVLKPFWPLHHHFSFVLLTTYIFLCLTCALNFFQLIWNYVGFELLMQVAAKNDHEIFMPLMLVVYNILTPTFVNVKLAMSIMFEIWSSSFYWKGYIKVP